ncbi:protein kinase [Planctomycetaceae bacterium]|nr:protein kinase [Planctomycetaceae bacterium]
MQIRCPHCQNPIELVQGDVSRDCPSCGKSVQPGDAETIVESEDNSPVNDTATLALDGELPSPVVEEAAAEQVHYFGDYELIEEIARGGMGVVYKARQISLNRTVAVKMILAGQLAGEEDVGRFLIEAEAAANLQHPHIVAIHEVGVHKGQHFFSMDYVEGTDLAAMVRENPLGARKAAGHVQHIASAIQYAHVQGTLHRDLKPSNILIDKQGEPHITDFGIAKRIEPGPDDTEVSPGAGTTRQQQEVAQLTATGAVLGTPGYMPPEQASASQREIGPRSDVYSMGAILYCLLTGRPPFQAENPLLTMIQVLRQEPVPLRLMNPSLSRDLETICLKCLEKDPSQRYQTAQQLADELECYLAGKPITARPLGRLERGWRWCRRNPMVAGLSTAVALSLVVGTVVSTSLAVEASRNAEDAETRRQQAVVAREDEQEQRKKAQEAVREVRELLYVSDMMVLEKEWERRNFKMASTLHARHQNSNERSFEWFYWKKQLEGALSLEFSKDGDAGHYEAGGVAFSPDGRYLASTVFSGASADDSKEFIVVWDMTSGEKCNEFPFTRIEQLIHASRFVPSRTAQMLNRREFTSGVALTSVSPTLHQGLSLRNERSALTDILSRPPQDLVGGSGNDRLTFEVLDTLTLQGGPSVIPPIPPTWLVHANLQFVDDAPVLAINVIAYAVLWDLQTDKLRVVNLPVDGLDNFSNGAFDKSGHRFVTLDVDGNGNHSLVVLDVKTQKKTRLPLESTPKPMAIASCSFSNDGTLLAVCVFDDEADEFASTKVHLIDIATTRQVRSLPGSRSLVFSPDDSQLAGVSEDQFIRVWDRMTGKIVRTIGDYEIRKPAENTAFEVLSLAFLGDNRRLAVSTGKDDVDGYIDVWDIHSGERLYRVEGFSQPVGKPTLSPDGQWLVASGGHAPRFVHASTGQACGRQLPCPSDIKTPNVLAISSDGRWAVVSGRSDALELVDIGSGRAVRSINGSFPRYGCRVAISTDSKWVVAASKNNGCKLYDLKSGTMVHDLLAPGAISTLSFSSDARQLAVGVSGGIKIFDLDSGKPRLEISEVSGGNPRRMAWSPDGRFLATTRFEGGDDAPEEARKVWIWDTETGTETSQLPAQSSTVECISFGPDGEMLITGDNDGTMRLWNLKDLQVVREFFGSRKRIADVVISPDGKRIASVSNLGVVKIWDKVTGHDLLSLKPAAGVSPPARLSFSADGRSLIGNCGRSGIKIWDTRRLATSK